MATSSMRQPHWNHTETPIRLVPCNLERNCTVVWPCTFNSSCIVVWVQGTLCIKHRIGHSCQSGYGHVWWLWALTAVRHLLRSSINLLLKLKHDCACVCICTCVHMQLVTSVKSWNLYKWTAQHMQISIWLQLARNQHWSHVILVSYQTTSVAHSVYYPPQSQHATMQHDGGITQSPCCIKLCCITKLVHLHTASKASCWPSGPTMSHCHWPGPYNEPLPLTRALQI